MDVLMRSKRYWQPEHHRMALMQLVDKAAAVEAAEPKADAKKAKKTKKAAADTEVAAEATEKKAPAKKKAAKKKA